MSLYKAMGKTTQVQIEPSLKTKGKTPQGKTTHEQNDPHLCSLNELN